jgi:hypothetical protein
MEMEISEKEGRGEVILRLEKRTMAAKFKIQIIGYLYIDNPQKTLVSSFELALIKDLHCDDRRILDLTEC